MSTAAFSEIGVSWYPRETEASILTQLLRLSRLTLLYGEAGAGKTALLRNGVLPRLRRRASDRDFTVAPESPKELPFPDRRRIHTAAERAPEVAIFFDEWNEAPLAALEARLRGALPAGRPRPAEPAASMAKNLRAWNKELGVRFLIIFDAFDQYLAASRDAPGIRNFGAQFVEVLEDDRSPANFLLALRDERPLLERFEGRIARIGDTSVRLPPWHQHRAGARAAAAPDLGDATAPAPRPTPDSGLHTITGASNLLDGASPVLKAVPKRELQTVRETSEVGESASPVPEVIAFELAQSPSPVVTAEPESNSRTAPGVSELADSRSPVEPVPTLNSEVVDARSPEGPTLGSPPPHGLGAQHGWANRVRLHWRVKLAWLALPLIGIPLLLIVLTLPKPPSEVKNVLTTPKPPSQVTTPRPPSQVTTPRPASQVTTPKPASEVKSVVTKPEPPRDLARTPPATERSTAAQHAGGVSEIARLMARANALLAQGDIASARIVLERAVDLGSAKAAFGLAETYDPHVLEAWRTFGTLGDVARAKQLYAKARAGGVQEAQDRLNALATLTP
ncbi:MAG TPA: AAA family ATPase [Burkholderiales bacterium]